jgi:hypothetical protein
MTHVLTFHVIMAVLVVPVWRDVNAPWLFAISIASHAFVDRR